MREIDGKGKIEVMRVVKQILFTLAMVVGLSLAVFAQKDDQKKPPPKDNPPVVNPGDKRPPRDNPPKNDPNKPKKPGFAIEIGAKANRIEIV